MFEIFINYRKADARYGAAATYELLAGRFERKWIFLDNQSLRPGTEYPTHLRAALECMRVLVVLIGPGWLSAHPADERLLLIEREGDWVRREIRRALERGVPIVPVLLDRASLPDPALLPADIRKLVYYQVVTVRHEHLGQDVRALGDRLVELVPPLAVGSAAAGPRRSSAAVRVSVPHQLPSAVRTFVGRAGQVAELDEVLGADSVEGGDGVPIVVVDGAAGVGKTCLAVWWAHRAQRQFPDGTLFADLGGYGPGAPLDPSLVLTRFLRGLGVPRRRVPSDLDAQVGMYRSLVAERRMLVVLDNGIDADQIRSLLPGTASCRVLVTSRTALTGLVVAEGAHRIVLDVFTDDEAGELVRATVGGDRLAAELPAVAELARLCARLPLALRVATARLAGHRHLGVVDMVDELTHTHGRVDALSRTGDPRTAVRTVFDWSLARLPPTLGRRFHCLGVQPALAFSVHAAAALFRTDVATAQRHLDELANVHLVEATAPRRYQLHELLHSYAADRSNDDAFAGERHEALKALFGWYAATATAADRLLFPTHPAVDVALEPVAVAPPFSERAGAWAWLTEEYTTLLALLGRAADQDLHATTIALAAATRFLALMAPAAWHDRLQAETRGLSAAVSAGDRLAETAFLHRRADTHQMLGNWAASDADLERSIAFAEEDGDDVLRGHALCGLGRNRKLQHGYAEALNYYTMALPLVHGVGTGYVEAVVEANLSQLNARLGRHHDALHHAERELVLHRDGGDAVAQAYALHDLATAHQGLGDHVTAVALADRAVIVFRAAAGTERYLASALETRAESLVCLGDIPQARQCLDEAAAVLDGVHDPRAEAMRQRVAALRSSPAPEASWPRAAKDSLVCLGNVPQAKQCFDEATAVLDGADDPQAEAMQQHAAALRSPGPRSSQLRACRRGD